MGEDHNPDLLAKSIVGKDYTRHEGIDKGYIDNAKQKIDNKAIVEKQNCNIFQHNQLEMP